MELEALNIAYRSLITVAMLAGPMLAAGLCTGLLIGLFQAVTSIQEQTLTFIPKLMVTLGVMAYCLPWMTQTIVSFTSQLLIGLPSFAR